MFEICSERGKAERILDLSPDVGDLSMQQSITKGLQEVAACFILGSGYSILFFVLTFVWFL